MARPKNKKYLLMDAKSGYIKLNEMINSLSIKDQSKKFLFEDRDKNIRDVLIHLFEWHKLWILWVKENQKGKNHSFLPAPYNWRTYPDMNLKIWEKHQETSLQEAKSTLDKTHKEVMDMIECFSDQQLFSKGVFNWTGKTSLGAYSISATSSHYQWAIKKISKHIKAL